MNASNAPHQPADVPDDFATDLQAMGGLGPQWEQIDAGDTTAPPAMGQPSEPASPATQHREQEPGTDGEQAGNNIAQTHTDAGQSETGDVPSIPTAENAATPRAHARVDVLAITKRLQADGRWKESIEALRNQMMKESKKRFPDKGERQQWVYSELDRLYPPLESSDHIADANKMVYSEHIVNKEGPNSSGNTEGVLNNFGTTVPVLPSDAGSIQGLGTLPASWPDLPANASLASEIGWVQANRLRVVTEKPGGATVVRLVNAMSPAPSWAALGWLETSIRSYAKFVDVASKASGSDDGEGALLRRERMSLDEVRSLLAEMEDDASGK